MIPSKPSLQLLFNGEEIASSFHPSASVVWRAEQPLPEDNLSIKT
jgi:hypothetical protein